MVVLKKGKRRQKDFWNFGKFFLALVALILLFWKARSTLDPDFGWHWRMGEIILTSGIPKTDPFSYTMPSFPFVDHEWLTNVLFYYLYNWANGLFLKLIFPFLVTVILIISLWDWEKSKENFLFKIGLLVLSFGSIFPFFSIRPQVFSWFLFAIWLKIIFKERISWHDFLWLSLLVIIWANLHGSFPLAILTFGLVRGAMMWQEKELRWQEVGCLGIFLLATLVNPYGWRLWEEVWRQISDTKLAWRISEWMPTFLVPVFPYLFLVSWIFLLYRYWRRFGWSEIALYFFLLILSLKNLRHVPFFVLYALPFYLKLLKIFSKEVLSVKFGEERWRKAGVFVFFFCILITAGQIFGLTRGSRVFSEEDFYPMAAVAFLKQNLPKGEVLSLYNWGGYLIWKLPEKKVFIDGRMPSWRWKNAPPSESKNAMDDYLKMQETEEDFKREIKKYNITTILWSNTKEEKFKPKSFESFFQKIFHFNFKGNFSLVDFLEKEGWREVYKDDLAVIYTNE